MITNKKKYIVHYINFEWERQDETLSYNEVLELIVSVRNIKNLYILNTNKQKDEI
jgi:hypothetical protein